MDSQSRTTLLTSTIPNELKQPRDDKRLHIDRINVLCQCYVESLKCNSYSYMNTVKAVCGIIATCIENKMITQDSGERVLGHYMLKCQPFIDNKGKGSRQIPSELVKVINDGNWWLRAHHGCKTAENNNGDRVTYVYQYETLKQYGVPISENQIKKWEYRK